MAEQQRPPAEFKEDLLEGASPDSREGPAMDADIEMGPVHLSSGLARELDAEEHDDTPFQAMSNLQAEEVHGTSDKDTGVDEGASRPATSEAGVGSGTGVGGPRAPDNTRATKEWMDAYEVHPFMQGDDDDDSSPNAKRSAHSAKRGVLAGGFTLMVLIAAGVLWIIVRGVSSRGTTARTERTHGGEAGNQEHFVEYHPTEGLNQTQSYSLYGPGASMRKYVLRYRVRHSNGDPYIAGLVVKQRCASQAENFVPHYSGASYHGVAQGCQSAGPSTSGTFLSRAATRSHAHGCKAEEAAQCSVQDGKHVMVVCAPPNDDPSHLCGKERSTFEARAASARETPVDLDAANPGSGGPGLSTQELKSSPLNYPPDIASAVHCATFSKAVCKRRKASGAKQHIAFHAAAGVPVNTTLVCAPSSLEPGNAGAEAGVGDTVVLAVFERRTARAGGEEARLSVRGLVGPWLPASELLEKVKADKSVASESRVKSCVRMMLKRPLTPGSQPSSYEDVVRDVEQVSPVTPEVAVDPVVLPLSPLYGAAPLQWDGTGSLSQWGPNNHAHVALSRWNFDLGAYEVLVQARASGWVPAGGEFEPFLVPASSEANEGLSAEREFMKSAAATAAKALRGAVGEDSTDLFSKLSSCITAAAASGGDGRAVVYQGVLDDPRNTNNAWVQATVFWVHCDSCVASEAAKGACMAGLNGLGANADGTEADFHWLSVEALDGTFPPSSDFGHALKPVREQLIAAGEKRLEEGRSPAFIDLATAGSEEPRFLADLQKFYPGDGFSGGAGFAKQCALLNGKGPVFGPRGADPSFLCSDMLAEEYGKEGNDGSQGGTLGDRNVPWEFNALAQRCLQHPASATNCKTGGFPRWSGKEIALKAPEFTPGFRMFPRDWLSGTEAGAGDGPEEEAAPRVVDKADMTRLLVPLSPLHPHPGVLGRGVLPFWGPNPELLLIVSRATDSRREIAVRRMADQVDGSTVMRYGLRGVPLSGGGGFETAAARFAEDLAHTSDVPESFTKLLAHCAAHFWEMYKLHDHEGPLADPRNTDNAWVHGKVLWIHCNRCPVPKEVTSHLDTVCGSVKHRTKGDDDMMRFRPASMGSELLHPAHAKALGHVLKNLNVGA